MSEIDGIEVMFCFEAPGESEKYYLLREKGLLLACSIFDVCACAVPAHIFGLRFFSTIAQDSHTVVIQRIWLYQVYDVQAVHLSFPQVADPEVKPLGHGCAGAMVEFQVEVVLVFRYLRCLVQVPRFEPGLKSERRVTTAFLLVKIRQFVEVTRIDAS